jgi:hypothetical protein
VLVPTKARAIGMTRPAGEIVKGGRGEFAGGGEFAGRGEFAGGEGSAGAASIHLVTGAVGWGAIRRRMAAVGHSARRGVEALGSAPLAAAVWELRYAGVADCRLADMRPSLWLLSNSGRMTTRRTKWTPRCLSLLATSHVSLVLARGADEAVPEEGMVAALLLVHLATWQRKVLLAVEWATRNPPGCGRGPAKVGPPTWAQEAVAGRLPIPRAAELCRGWGRLLFRVARPYPPCSLQQGASKGEAGGSYRHPWFCQICRAHYPRAC